MYIENDDNPSYINIIQQEEEFINSLPSIRAQAPYYVISIYFQAVETELLGDSNITFVYNPLKDYIYTKVAEKKTFSSDQQYFIKSANNTYEQVDAGTLTEFDPNTEYYFLIDSTTYQCVDNLKTRSLLLSQIPDSYDNHIYYKQDNNYVALGSNQELEYNIKYYIRKPVQNLTYYNSLSNDQKFVILDLSEKAIQYLQRIVEVIRQHFARPERKQNGNVLDGLSENPVSSANTHLSTAIQQLQIPELEAVEQGVQEALQKYIAIVQKYQSVLREKQEQYQEFLTIYNEQFENEADKFNINTYYGLHLYNSIDHEEYKYFYKDSQNRFPNDIYIVGQDKIYFLNESELKFFTIVKDDKLTEDGVAYWYKTILSDVDLSTYQDLLTEALELQDIYNKQYKTYLEKYQMYLEEAQESQSIYSSYAGTEELQYYLEHNQNDSSTNLDTIREEVREAWWAFLNLLDDRYTAERARGMYV